MSYIRCDQGPRRVPTRDYETNSETGTVRDVGTQSPLLRESLNETRVSYPDLGRSNRVEVPYAKKSTGRGQSHLKEVKELPLSQTQEGCG